MRTATPTSVPRLEPTAVAGAAAVEVAPTKTPTGVVATPTPMRVVTTTETAARVRLEADSASLRIQETMTVSIAVEGVVNLYGAELHLVFDQDLVQILDADDQLEGVQIAPGPSLARRSHFAAVNQVNNELGHVYYTVTLLKPALPLGGTVQLAAFELVGKAAGSARIEALSVDLVDEYAQAIPAGGEWIVIEVEE
ncbi:MAG: hypothetical protein FJZ90_02630 [Chloroflexi bacterium]|nr:hypothetical protein [Chloroflexota bacterium]